MLLATRSDKMDIQHVRVRPGWLPGVVLLRGQRSIRLRFGDSLALAADRAALVVSTPHHKQCQSSASFFLNWGLRDRKSPVSILPIAHARIARALFRSVSGARRLYYAGPFVVS